MEQCHNNSIGRLVYQVTMAMRKYLEHKLRPYDLTAEQFQVLKQLALGGGRTQNTLCEALFKSPANVTRILDRLEKKVYLERRENPQDRRSSLVFLTEEGGVLVRKVSEELGDFQAMVTRGMTVTEVESMRSGLLTILANLESCNGEKGEKE